MSEKIPFLDMFPDCASLQDSCGGLDKAEVLDVLIERESMTMQLRTWFARMPAPVERTNIEQLLAAQFRCAAYRSRRNTLHRSRKRPSRRPRPRCSWASPSRSARTSRP